MKNYLLTTAICLGIILNTVNAQQKTAFKKIAKNYFVMPSGATSEDYLPQTLIFKVKSGFRNVCDKESINIPVLQDALNTLGIKEMYKQFPNHTVPERPTNSLGQKLTDLSLIYRLKYSSNTPIEDAVNLLYQSGVLEYVCLSVTPKPMFTPNDTYVSSNQYALKRIKAFDAWDIEQGDTNVVIGITDTGFELTHEDLGANMKYNYADPIDGIDNDNDGYIDNFRGWDMSMNDNDPAWVTHSHGVGVAGAAAATTNNGKGIAGVGFNCKYLPVKCMDDLSNTLMTNTYESIVYAADHGSKIINCSWGGTLMPGQYGQDVIDYAVINKDIVVVASAGNNGNTDVFYPASYNYVVSVAAVDSNDLKPSISCYGYYIDVASPGKSVYLTYKNNAYGNGTGTSVAAPEVSGGAALIRSHFPNLSALQVLQLLKSSADKIDTLAGNAAYVDALGAGRINLYKALTDSISPGIMMISKNITDGNDENYYSNDTLSITAEFANLLAPTSNLTVTLSSTDSNVNIINGSINLGVINTLNEKDNNNNPFKVAILSSATTDEEIPLKVTYSDGAYTSFEYIVFKVNQDYLNIVPNQIATTLTGIGRIGYNGTFASEGNSITYHDYGLAYASSFLIGNSASNVEDGFYSGTLLYDYTYDNDFTTIDNIKEVKPAVYADNDYYTKFNDNNATAPLGVEVAQRTYAWNETGYDKFIIVEYDVKNTNVSTLSNLYAGIITDWDIFYSTLNAAHIDTTHKIGYAKSLTHNIFTGVHLITSGNFISYGIDWNQDNGSVGYYVDGGFSDAEKFTCLTTMRDSAGYTGSAYGEDVGNSVSMGPFSLNASASTTIAFAIMVGSSEGELQNIAAAADEKYNLMHSPMAIIENQINNTCNASCNGEAEVGIAGGAQPFSYLWTDADSQTTAVATNLCAGNYSVVVADANGVFDTLAVNITEPDPIITSLSGGIDDGNCNGEATVDTIFGGTSPYTYLWNDSLLQTDSNATMLCYGMYTVMILDANGCVHYDSVNVNLWVGINELSISNGLGNYYPNPTSGKLVLDVNIAKVGNYEMGIYNVTGEKVFDIVNGKLSQQNYKYTIDVSSLPAGAYFIQFMSDEGTQAKKIIIAR